VLGRAPVRTIDFADPAQRARHDRLVELADEMAALAAQLRQATDADRPGLLERQGHIDRTIDEAVYELYGLTDAEVAAVEEGLGPGTPGIMYYVP
jgi:hypothetical protein